jgi:membrane fusion protein (multidrug efflux system)
MSDHEKPSSLRFLLTGPGRFVAVGLVLIVVIGGIAVLRPAPGGLNAPGVPGPPPGDRPQMRLPVDGVVLNPSRVDNRLYATGNILAAEDVELRSEVSGKVVEIRFREGSQLQKGDLLVKINDRDLQAQFRKAQSNKALLEDRVSRQRKLREINAVSQEEVDQAVNQLTAVTADIDLLLAQIQKTEVRAPFDGVVGLRLISEGSYITPNSVIARFVDIRSVKVDFSIPEKYTTQVSVGTQVRFTLEAVDRAFTGEVYAVEPRIDPATRTLRMRALAQNRDGSIVPGTFAKIELILSTDEKGILAPTHSLVPDIEGTKAYVVRDGRARLFPVTTGIRTEGFVQVTEGLHEGDTLIVSGLLQLRDNLPVNVRIENE